MTDTNQTNVAGSLSPSGQMASIPTPGQGAATQSGVSGLAGVPVSNGLLLSRVEALITRLDARALKEEATIKSFVAKYWPIAVGIGVALSRLVH